MLKYIMSEVGFNTLKLLKNPDDWGVKYYDNDYDNDITIYYYAYKPNPKIKLWVANSLFFLAIDEKNIFSIIDKIVIWYIIEPRVRKAHQNLKKERRQRIIDKIFKQ